MSGGEFKLRHYPAPELLEACQRILRAIKWGVTEDRLDENGQAEILNAAIAKATGGHP